MVTSRDKNNVTAAEIVLAVEAGFRGIDTAFDYLDETGVATGIKEVIASGKVSRGFNAHHTLPPALLLPLLPPLPPPLPSPSSPSSPPTPPLYNPAP